jgi:hypothetical protein
MAEVVDQFPPVRYQEYFDGQLWKLTPGEDGSADAAVMRIGLETSARFAGVKVKVRVHDGFVYVQADVRPRITEMVTVNGRDVARKSFTPDELYARAMKRTGAA